jgi:hypothetical protein
MQSDDVEHCSLAIVGGGPHALTLALRLLDRLNNGGLGSGDIGEAENARRSFGIKGACCDAKPLQVAEPKTSKVLQEAGIRIFDPSGAWLKRWIDQFEALQIVHLRSPARVHPWAFVDPLAMVAFAISNDRGHEILHGSSVFERLQASSKNRKCRRALNPAGTSLFNEVHRASMSYGLPSQKLFVDFCRHLIARFGIEDAVEQRTVSRVIPIVRGGKVAFRLLFRGAERPVVAEQVVLAHGFSPSSEVIPTWAHSLPVEHVHALIARPSLLHQPAPPGLADPVALVVGGGLSAGHAVLALAQQGYRCYLVSRRPLVVKQFDLAPAWFSTASGRLRHDLWREDLPTRLALCRKARDGGSVTPEVMAALDGLVHAGRVLLLQGWTVESAAPAPSDPAALAQPTTLILRRTCPPGPAPASGRDLPPEAAGEQLTLVAARVVLATGVRYDARADPLLADLLSPHPLASDAPSPGPATAASPGPAANIATDAGAGAGEGRPAGGLEGLVEGLPVLTPGLGWSGGRAVYLMGAPAMLGVGPDSANLNGALVASALIADALRLDPRWTPAAAGLGPPRAPQPPRVAAARALFGASHENRFGALGALAAE